MTTTRCLICADDLVLDSAREYDRFETLYCADCLERERCEDCQRPLIESEGLRCDSCLANADDLFSWTHV